MIKTWEQRMPARLPESMIDCAMMQVQCMADEINELTAENKTLRDALEYVMDRLVDKNEDDIAAVKARAALQGKVK